MKTNLFNIARNTGATIVIRGLFGLTRIFLLLLIAKRFGPEDFGRLSLVVSLVEIMRVSADFGIDIVTIRRFALNKLLSEKILGNILSLKLITATIGYLLSIGVFWIIYRSPEGLKLLLIVGASLYTSLFLNAFVSYFQANLMMSQIVISSIAAAVLYTVFTSAGIYYNWPLLILAAIIPLSELVNLLITAKIYGGFSTIKLNYSRRIALSIIKEGAPVWIGGMAAVAYMRLDNLMLGWFLGERGVGEYAVAYRLIEPFMLIFSSLSLSVYSAMSRSSKNWDITNIRESVLKILLSVLIVSSSSAFLILFFADNIMAMVSNQYVGSIKVLQILSISIILKAVSTQLNALINSAGRYNITTFITIISFVTTAGLNLIMIPRYGILGAAFTVVLTDFVNMTMQSVFALNILGFSFSKRTARVL